MFPFIFFSFFPNNLILMQWRIFWSQIYNGFVSTYSLRECRRGSIIWRKVLKTKQFFNFILLAFTSEYLYLSKLCHTTLSYCRLTCQICFPTSRRMNTRSLYSDLLNKPNVNIILKNSINYAFKLCIKKLLPVW